MAAYRDWDDFVKDVDATGGVACFHLDILLEIHGCRIAGTQAHKDITKSLKKRGFGIQPINIAHIDPKSYIRVYRKNTPLGRLLDTTLDISLDGNTALRKLAERQERNDTIDQLIALAKTIARD